MIYIHKYILLYKDFRGLSWCFIWISIPNFLTSAFWVRSRSSITKIPHSNSRPLYNTQMWTYGTNPHNTWGFFNLNIFLKGRNMHYQLSYHYLSIIFLLIRNFNTCILCFQLQSRILDFVIVCNLCTIMISDIDWA